MNQHLQSILNIIQQDESLTVEEKNAIIKSLKSADKELEITLFKLNRTEKVKKTTAILLEETIEELEQKRKAVEAQNRELEIESSLERVRTEAMGMRKADDLLNICKIIFKELQSLGFTELRNALIHTFVDQQDYFIDYDYSDFFGGKITRIPCSGNPLIERFLKETKKSNDAFTEIVVTGTELDEWREFRKAGGQIDDPRLNNASSVYYYYYSIEAGDIGVSAFSPISEAQRTILKRFRNVFGFAYRRFIDIQKAEAQAKEAQIEAALEKVRSRSLAMHRSDELQEVANTLFERLNELNVKVDSANIAIFEEGKRDFVFWVASLYQKGVQSFHIPYSDLLITKDLVTARESGTAFFGKSYSFEEKNEWFNYAFKNTAFQFLSEERKQMILEADAVTISMAFSKNTGIQVTNYSDKLLSDEKVEILKRFSKVFEQAYIRFLDLQNAETQARESQIQLALERVRARTMAMQKSDELMETAVVLFNQLNQLGEHIERTIIGVMNEEQRVVNFWATRPDGSQMEKMQKFPFDEPIVMQKVYGAWQQQKKSIVIDLHGEELDSYFQFMKARSPRLKRENFGERRVETFAFFSKGMLGIISADPNTPPNVGVYERFAAVFDQTYTRFLDLQKAEAQAKEATIETALERVRSRSMAMHKSDDLHEVIRVVTEQLSILGLKFNVANFAKIDPDGSWNTWLSTLEQTYPALIYVPYLDHPIFNDVTEQITKNNDFYTHVYTREESNIFFRHFFENTIAKNTPEERKQFVYSSKGFTRSLFLIKNIWFSVSRYDTTPFTDEENAIFKRFAKVFEQAYTRFLDLQKAEAQAREANIEASLERVRAKTMAMHSSNDVGSAIVSLFTELERLGIENMRCGIAIYNKNQTMDVWSVTNVEEGKTVKAVGNLDTNAHKLWRLIYKAWENKSPSFHYYLSGKEKQDYLSVLNSAPNYLSQPLLEMPDMDFQTYNFNEGGIWTFSMQPHSEQQVRIMNRFTSVFSQTFRRYQDLQKAEAQARESQIELGLERVRARAMAMQKSHELKELIATVSNELGKLDIVLDRCFIMTYDHRSNDSTWWMANPETPSEPVGLLVQYHKHRAYLALLNAWHERKLKSEYILEGETKKTWDKFLFTDTELSKLPVLVSENMQAKDKVYISSSYNNFGSLTLATLEPLSNEQFDIMLRFAKVFDLTYTRFNDLKQAESQAREAQIELGLERVRARAMAMKTSEELNTLIGSVFIELTKLDLVLTRCVILIYEGIEKGVRWWMANSEAPTMPMSFFVKYADLPFFNAYLNGWNERKLKWQYILEGKNKIVTDDFVFTETELSLLPDFVIAGMRTPKRVYLNASFNNFGNLTLASLEPLSDEHFDILLRFAKVFDLTYTRFNDLKQAEAQAKESQIQLALERVRARTMAMQKSDELSETAVLLFHQIMSLGLDIRGCGFNIWEKDEKTCTAWMSGPEGTLTPPFNLPLTEDPFFIRYYESRQKGEDFWVHETNREELIARYKYMQTLPVLGELLAKDQADGIEIELPPFVVDHAVNFSNGNLIFITHKNYPEAWDIFKRFGKLFEQTYTRFLDLQKAEAQTREAQIEASLERVRSKAMAMHSSQDLANTIGVFYHELELFSITPRRCGVGLLNKETRVAELSTMNSTEQGKSIEIIGEIKMEGHPVLEGVYDNWLLKNEFHPVLRGSEIRDYYQLLKPQIAFPEYPHDAMQYGYFFFFPEGGVYAWTNKEMEEDELLIYRRFTSVLSLTYKRYKDLQQAEDLAHKAEQDLILLKEEKKRTEDALTELKITQKQLIQSEKMASLGELTAGIAHEIQNPLNFVNNFSEVSTELLDEMIAELKNDNGADAVVIASDLKQNLEKILHHGKRADTIVKGMLQHSRTSSAIKEPTDINKLADEYLRLAYHGLRAKDNFFNAAIETDYDESIGDVNIIPQDIGRVILNLITNAFYAVTEKKKQVGNGYEPTVSLSTRKSNGTIEIEVKDNGNGIPQKVLDKIFQPFFTTKPTGQGTGLGLSLSYDIVKAHGGEIRVKTKESEGAEFTLLIPAHY